MIEENSVARKHVVRLTVVNDDPVAVHLGDGVRTSWIKRGLLALRDLLDLSVEFRSGGLVEADFLSKTTRMDRIEQTECSDGIDFGRVLGKIERDLHMGLGCQMVNL